MNILIWGFISVVIVGLIFMAGYLFAAREYEKDLRFYKDCIKNQRTVLQAQNSSHLKTLEEYQVAEKGLQYWIECKIDSKATEISNLSTGTINEAFCRGEKFSFQAVLLHLKGYL
jgi:hypothetical protein